MPKPVKGTPEEREQYMLEVFQKFYQDPKNAGRDLSVQRANDEFRKKYGSMLRNKRAYAIRRNAKVQAGAPPEQSRKAVSANREAVTLVEPGSRFAAALVNGTPEQLTWFREVLPLLASAGLAQARIDHTSSTYVVVTRT
jgi:hypothetical protein